MEIVCSDPGTCTPSGNPPSPVRQLDAWGIGTFSNLGNGKSAPTFAIASKDGLSVQAEPNGNKNFDGTYHYFELNFDDLGEPGNGPVPDNVTCPSEGFGLNGATYSDAPLGEPEPSRCDCPDFYRIIIHNGVSASAVSFGDDGNLDAASEAMLKSQPVIYQVQGYLDGGNLQIHSQTGFDSK
jgi:hypothetical protein